MELTINGVKKNIEEIQTVANLLDQLGYQSNFIAVAINKTCIKRSDFAVHKIEDGDNIEILAPMAGG